MLSHRGSYGGFELPGDVHHREWTARTLSVMFAGCAFALRFSSTTSLAAFFLRAHSLLLRGGRRLLRSLLLLRL